MQYRGFILKKVSVVKSEATFEVQIHNQTLRGSLSGVKKSIDWWVELKELISPKILEQTKKLRNEGGMLISYKGYTIKNDTGKNTAWYSIVKGRLVKGSFSPICRHIDSLA